MNRRSPLFPRSAFALLFAVGLFFSASVALSAAAQESPNFSRDIAPIVFQHCAPCHRPGQPGPFPLLNYADVRKRARDIADVTTRRLMPPWLPEPGYGDFAGDRRLEQSEIDLINRWVSGGAPEGNTNDLPPMPVWPGDWPLGEPDLIVQTPAYTLAAEGQDVYFNLVVPIPVSRTRFIKGVDFIAGNRVVHHAFVNIDETRTARRLGAKNSPPGFPGMDLPESVVMPGGQLLGFQPGKMSRFTSQGLSWVLRTNTDLVLQLHMNPSGKPEIVQPRVGFYFTDHPPTNSAFRVRLTALELDIPAGASNYVAERSYTLPVDLTMVRVGTHAHYLAREMQGFALLPNGEKKWLIWIKNWDFKWQGDYEYREPVFLPKGSQLVMRFTYDNSANNPRNPYAPPRRILWGLGSADEMGELYFQAMPRNRDDYIALRKHYSEYFARVSMDYYRFRLKNNPADAEAHQRLGRSLAALGDAATGETHLKEAVRLDPNQELAYFDLGSIYLRHRKFGDAYAAFQQVVRLNPDDSQAHGSLGIICLQVAQWEQARRHLETAVRLNPEDVLAARYLAALKEKLP